MSLLFGISTYIIMSYLIIFLIWGYVGDGAYPRSWNTYINIIYACSALIFLSPIVYYRIKINYKKGDFSKEKNYIIVFLIVLLMSGIIAYKSLV